ncbi:MAG: hypothetical protein HDS16_05365 [Bacteroides sp.]|nr:hypothetical protein [Bacteroides sp.]
MTDEEIAKLISEFAREEAFIPGFPSDVIREREEMYRKAINGFQRWLSYQRLEMTIVKQ